MSYAEPLELIEDTLREPITAANVDRIEARLQHYRSFEWKDRRYEEAANDLINEGLSAIAEFRGEEE